VFVQETPSTEPRSKAAVGVVRAVAARGLDRVPRLERCDHDLVVLSQGEEERRDPRVDPPGAEVGLAAGVDLTCCHPALATDAQVALTLRTLGGLTTGEIASAFLAGEPAMTQRLVRAKRKIRWSLRCSTERPRHCKEPRVRPTRG